MYTDPLTNTTNLAPTVSKMTTSVRATVQKPGGPRIPTQCEALLKEQCKLHKEAFQLLNSTLNKGIQDLTQVMDKHDQMLTFHNIYKEMAHQLPHNDPKYPRVKENTAQNKVLLTTLCHLIRSAMPQKTPNMGGGSGSNRGGQYGVDRGKCSRI